MDTIMLRVGTHGKISILIPNEQTKLEIWCLRFDMVHLRYKSALVYFKGIYFIKYLI